MTELALGRDPDNSLAALVRLALVKKIEAAELDRD